MANQFMPEKEVIKLKQEYPPGTRIVLNHMAMLSVYWSISGITARNCGNGSSKATVPSRYRSKNRRRIRLSMHRLCHNLTK